MVDASAPEDELAEMLAAVDDVLAEVGAASARGCWRSTRSTCSMTSAGARWSSATRGRCRFRRDRGGARRAPRRHRGRFLPLRPIDLLVPYAEGGSLSELHDVAGELEREDTAEGVRVRARVPAAAAARFERFRER